MNPKHVGPRLRDARIAKGLTQEQVATHLGVRMMTISRAERGYSLMRPPTLEAAADFLDVSLAWLLTGEGGGPRDASRGAA